MLFLFRTHIFSFEFDFKITLISKQRELLNRIRTIVEEKDDESNFSNETNEKSREMLHESCLYFCLNLLQQRARVSEYESSLICVLIILDLTKKEFKKSKQYTSLLLFVIKISQYLIVRATIRLCRDDSIESNDAATKRFFIALIDIMMKRFMLRDTHFFMK